MINKIIEFEKAFEYLYSRGLVNQYKKAKEYILQWYFNKVDFKLRQPKQNWIYQFRINQKYRAFWYIDSIWCLVVFKISDYQD